MSLDAQRPICFGSLLLKLMWGLLFSANGLRLRRFEGFAVRGI
jgi:hypothetical protein